MRALACGILVTVAGAAPLAAQERDHSLQRINLALQQPASPLVWDLAPEDRGPMKLGILTFETPRTRGEMVRISIPIGELVMKTIRGVGAANRRRQESAARRRVDAALDWFKAQSTPRQ